jgi:hypothetical protein
VNDNRDDEIYTGTEGEHKMLAYFEDLKKRKDFIDEIASLRKLHNQELSLVDAVTDKVSDEIRDKYWNAVDEVCRKFKLAPIYSWSFTIHTIAVFDNWETYSPVDDLSANMCIVDTFEGFVQLSEKYRENDPSFLKAGYPVFIGIHPHASRQDVINYIKRSFDTEIAPLLDKHKGAGVNLEKIKKRSKSERDDFIFEHRHLPYAKLAKLCNDKFGGNLIYDYVGKVVRREMKRRGVTD